jgi:hypothetical protein
VTDRAEPAAVPSVEELVASPRLARALAPEAARDLYVALAPLVAELQVAATSPRSPVAAQAAADVWLTADEVAARLKTTRGAVYGLARRADWRHFCTRPNRRTLRINGRGLDRWLARQVPVAESLT